MLLCHLPVTSSLQELEFTDKLSCHIPVCPFSLIIYSFCSFDEHVTNTDMRSINTSSMKMVLWILEACLFGGCFVVVVWFVLSYFIIIFSVNSVIVIFWGREKFKSCFPPVSFCHAICAKIRACPSVFLWYTGTFCMTKIGSNVPQDTYMG